MRPAEIFVYVVVELVPEQRILVRRSVVVDMLRTVQTQAVDAHVDPLVRRGAYGLERIGLLALLGRTVVEIREPVCPEVRMVHHGLHARQQDVFGLGAAVRHERQRLAPCQLVGAALGAVLGAGSPRRRRGAHQTAPRR